MNEAGSSGGIVWRTVMIGLVVLAARIGDASAADEAIQIPVDADAGIVVVMYGCGGFVHSMGGFAGSLDTGFAWQYGGVSDQYGGSFASCFDFASATEICGVVLDLTRIAEEQGTGQPCDVFLWEDAGGMPGAVVVASTGNDFPPPPVWPYLGRQHVELNACVVDKVWFGGRGAWPGNPAGWFLGADLDTSFGCPMTYVSPGLDYPSGWQRLEIVWGTSATLGIWAGTTYGPCNPVPAARSSWGRIKTLYR